MKNGRRGTRALLSLGLVMLFAHVPDPASAQQASKRVVEHADFDVRLGFLRVGSGHWTVSAYDTVSGFPTFHAVLSISGGFGPARIDDRFESWGDATSWRTSRDVFSRRFVQTQREVNYQRDNRFEISPERQEWVRNGGPINKTPTSKPLDDLTMLVFVRSLPLKVGDVYVIPGYFKAEDNPVTIRVLRRETVTVPAGTFTTVVVRPTIKTSGLFGNAELYLTDDRFHSLIQLKSKARKLGSMTLQLKTYERPDATDDPQGTQAWGASDAEK